jgi:GT2 family glycosyltransferase
LIISFPESVMIRSIAAVVPCYNRKAKTIRFVEAFLQQTYPDLALVIVDAGSRDGTIEAVGDRMLQAPGIQTYLLSVSEDCYWAAATNAGVEFALAQGYEYIFTINDDSVIGPDHLAKLMQIATEHQAPILGSRIDYLDDPGLLWSLGVSLDWRRHLVALRDRDRRFDDLPLEIQQAPLLQVDALVGDGVLIHRRVFEAIGLYQAQYLPHYWADSEWTIRAQRAGFPVAVTPQTVLYDDYPTPTEREQLKASSLREPFFPALTYRLFHVRSGENLLAKCYVIWKHCPIALKPWAFFRRGLSIVNWCIDYSRTRKQPTSNPSAHRNRDRDRSKTLTSTP